MGIFDGAKDTTGTGSPGMKNFFNMKFLGGGKKQIGDTSETSSDDSNNTVVAEVASAQPKIKKQKDVGMQEIFLQDLAKAMEQFAQGNLDVRLETMDMDPSSDIKKIFDNFNDGMDQVDSLVKGIDNSLTEVMDLTAAPKVYDSGLKGYFKLAAINVDNSLTLVKEGFKATKSTEVKAKIDALGGPEGWLTHDTKVLQNSLSETTEETLRIQKTSEETLKSSNQVADGVVHLRSMTNELKKMMEMATGAKFFLETDVEGIETIVKEIEKFTNDTNALAINAGIQASQAGDFGKGFGVVAANIQKLAAKIETSLSQIHRVIKEFMKSSDQIGKSIEKTNEISKQFETKMTEFESVVNLLKDQALDNSDMSKYLSRKTYVSLIEVDHILFKIGAYNMLFEKESKDLSTHTSCRLGKFFHNEGKALFGEHDLYPRIDKHHKKVHQIAQDMVKQKDMVFTSPGVLIALAEEIQDSTNQVFEDFPKVIQDTLHPTKKIQAR
ncbi:MAG: methyl-accepting chemotaxis protein [Patescibacteria group bacterium]|nr:methyl-accepting chemotaxis protein [Patescibacteria group bacterium]